MCDIKIRELFQSQSNWIRGAYANASDGVLVEPASDIATCWCLVGAVDKCYPHPSVRDAVQRVLADGIKGDNFNPMTTSLAGTTRSFIIEWNDHPSRTFQEVKDLVERLDV